MQQREDRHERADSGSLQKPALPHGSGEIPLIRHEGNHCQGEQLRQLRDLFRRADRMIERFRCGAGTDSACKG